MSKRSTKFYRKNEEEVMKRIGLNPTINSGAGWIQKEDGENDLFICQLKSTDNKSISVKQDDLNVLEYHAVISHKIPVFAFQFLNTDKLWVSITEDEFKEYMKFKKEKNFRECFSLSPMLIKKDIDKEEDKSYNTITHDTSKMCCSRAEFYKQREMEREKEQKEFKDKMKERRKQVGKRVQTKRSGNI